MRTADLRSAYLDFFVGQGHRQVASSSLVPANDPTLLFTNAGMVPFKDALLGHEDLGYGRATSAQRCVRAGGKHNDLENVGYTARHLTFFEMMGNFSFGDYFKEETITWAWTFATQVMQLPTEKIWVTHYPDDADARELWLKKIGVPAERVIPLEENFWAMGDTGPCGPCTELFFDHGPEVAGGPPGSPDEDGDRFVEFWNLVFPQFDRSVDGQLTPLPKPGVDTGMGLERMAAVLQGVHSVYETDQFRRVIETTGGFAGIAKSAMLSNASLRVVADHIRSSSFLIADGILPGNEDRSYVLRRIIRRALRHGNKLGIEGDFFHKLVAPLVDEMGTAYPELAAKQAEIETALATEEGRFSETLSQGMELLDRSVAQLSEPEIPGDVAFKLYDTYGFPIDLTADVARERGLTLDMAGFDAAMEAQRSRGRASAKFDATLSQRIRVSGSGEFTGYEDGAGETIDAEVVALFRAQDSGDYQEVSELAASDRGVVILNRTPFYAESGGQVGDTGQLTWASGAFEVADTLVSAAQYLHQGTLASGSLAVGAEVRAEIDTQRRQAIALNHSATHLLHAALRAVLGNHVQQKGSLVDADRLRFDFAHPQPMTNDELLAVENMVGEQVLLNSAVETELKSFDEAVEAGAMALFGEKYSERVRVLSMGGRYSVELCGGTHVRRTGDIGLIKIVSETGIASGVRRIEALTGLQAYRHVQGTEAQLDEIARLTRGSRTDAAGRVEQLQSANRAMQKKLDALEASLAASRGTELVGKAVQIGELQLLAERVSGDAKALPAMLDKLKNKLGSSVIVLAAVVDDQIHLICGVSKDLTGQVKAGDVINHVARQVGAKGGGRPDMARAGGGTDLNALPGALASVAAWVREKLPETL